MPRLRRPRQAKLHEVRITRGAAEAIIEFLDPGISPTHLQLGPSVQTMTDIEILASFNDVVQSMERAVAEYHHIAVEVPPGIPQIRYFAAGEQWVPRGDVVRCLIDEGGENGEVTIIVDETELSLAEFGTLLRTYAGWGMRITFVPDNALEEQPEVEIREPDDDDDPGLV